MAESPGGPVLPWDMYREPAKARQPLSREAIVDAALKIIDEQGMAALSMRAVAHALGTGPASLYAHVANKEQLLDLVLDRVYGEFHIPEVDPANWQEQIKDFARSSLRTILTHRGLAAAMLGAPPMGPNGLRLMEGSIALMRGAGLPDAISAYFGELLGQYIAVTALEQESFHERFSEATPEQRNEWVSQFSGFLQSLPPAQFPNLVAMASSGQFMQPDSDDDRFELGLDIIVRGLASYCADKVTGLCGPRCMSSRAATTRSSRSPPHITLAAWPIRS